MSARSIIHATFVFVAAMFALVRTADAEVKTRIALIGLHGGVFDSLASFKDPLQVEFTYVTDQQLEKGDLDLSTFDLVVIEHVRGEALDSYRKAFESARAANPKLRVLSISGFASRSFPELVKSGFIVVDPAIEPYYGNTKENLRRFLVYVLAKHLGRELKIEPPVDVPLEGLYHPDHDGLFPDSDSFLRFAKDRGSDIDHAPRAAIAVHLTHLSFQQPKVVDALIREFEKHRVLAVAIVDQVPSYETNTLSFKPRVVVHTCHSKDSVEFREKLGVPEMHSIFFRNQSIADWETSSIGLASNELNLHIVTQELIGGIEPIADAGTVDGGGSAESFVPIPERVDHLVSRACRWIELQRKPESEKRIAVLYWDREMGKSELMRGSATGMFLNAPRSIVGVLKSMKEAGYRVAPLPKDEDELLEPMLDHGRQIGVYAPGELDRLARSGKAVLVPVETYRQWFESKVPKLEREAVVARWGEPPGKFLSWTDDSGRAFFVIPRVDFGNVVLLPQPLRGEASDSSLVHDRTVPPPHDYLCTYFWIQEEFKADAYIHFGTHGSEIALPGKDTGLSEHDWCDIVIGDLPNIYPWVQNNLGESSIARRRTNAVLIDHLVPPSVTAGLSDELANLDGDLTKWQTLDAGPLKERFVRSITRQCREQHLDRDLHIEVVDDDVMSADQIGQLVLYLHDIEEEKTNVDLHVFGQAPPEELRDPYLVTCLHDRFLDSIAGCFAIPATEPRERFLREKAQIAIRYFVREGLTPDQAIIAAGGHIPGEKIGDDVVKAFALAKQIDDGLLGANLEMSGLLAALDGRFITPGPGNAADRNPAAVPTGRNMYVMNPEEVPTRPSWEIGKQLAEGLLASQLKTKGRYPKRVAFTLSPFAAFQDYGVMESQILYLLGVRPVWDSKNLVSDVELIPAAELKRPRVDVFLATNGYYRDLLPTRMHLIDKAVRLVADLPEADNGVRENTASIEKALAEKHVDAKRAAMLARARMFGAAPGHSSGAAYYYLVERSGEWGSRDELIDRYIDHQGCAYTEGAWGDEASDAYREQLKSAEVVIRNWSDNTRSPLNNKYFWYQGGSLSLAIERLSGKEPEFFLADVRDPDHTRMVDAEDALREDYRVRLFNRKWIEGMMKEGYAGADQVAVCVSNSMGWKIMRKNSVTDDVWREIVDVYVRDSKHLHVREWFEAENPFAFQDLTETLLEVARKGYWKPDDAMLAEIATAYAESVVRHGEGGGIRGGGNHDLEAFVDALLAAPGNKDLDSLREALRARRDGGDQEKSATAKDARADIGPASKGQEPAAAKSPDVESKASPSSLEPVVGTKLQPSPDREERRGLAGCLLAGIALLLIVVGIARRTGAPA